MTRSYIAVAVGVAAAGIVVVWLLTRDSEPPRAAPVVRATQIAAVPAPTATPAAVAVATSTHRATATARPSETTRRTIAPTVTIMATPAPESYSLAIDDGVDPIQHERTVDVGESRGRNSRDTRLVTFPSSSSYEAPNPVFVYAYLAQVERNDDGGGRGTVNDAQRVPAREVMGELRNRAGEVLAMLTFHDDGNSGDAQAGDHVFTVQYLPTPEKAGDLGHLAVVVRATSQDGEERTATTSFLYGIPGARFTGQFRDDLVNGNLKLSVEVEVDDAATFELQATIADTHTKAVAWGQTTIQLEAGTHWIPLTYDGTIFRNHGVDGPYLVSSVALETVSDPPLRNDIVASPHRTQAYRASQFGGGR